MILTETLNVPIDVIHSINIIGNFRTNCITIFVGGSCVEDIILTCWKQIVTGFRMNHFIDINIDMALYLDFLLNSME